MNIPFVSPKKSEPGRSYLIAGIATGVVAIAGAMAWAYNALASTAKEAKKAVTRKRGTKPS